MNKFILISIILITLLPKMVYAQTGRERVDLRQGIERQSKLAWYIGMGPTGFDRALAIGWDDKAKPKDSKCFYMDSGKSFPVELHPDVNKTFESGPLPTTTKPVSDIDPSSPMGAELKRIAELVDSLFEVSQSNSPDRRLPFQIGRVQVFQPEPNKLLTVAISRNDDFALINRTPVLKNNLPNAIGKFSLNNDVLYKNLWGADIESNMTFFFGKRGIYFKANNRWGIDLASAELESIVKLSPKFTQKKNFLVSVTKLSLPDEFNAIFSSVDLKSEVGNILANGMESSPGFPLDPILLILSK